jgi:hypothetical protein
MGGIRPPQKPQKILMSSPSEPKNPNNPSPINHFPPKNSWHSSFPPTRIIKSVSKNTNRPGPTRRAFAFNTSHALSTSLTIIFLNTLRYYPTGGGDTQ